MQADAVATDQAAIWQIETNIDDLNPQLCEVATAAMFAAGALDVWWTPITMKKGRSALLCGALAPLACRDAVVQALLVETTTIGVRYFAVERTMLARRFEVVATSYGAVSLKVSSLAGRDVTVTPEYEDCVRLAQAAGVTVRTVIAAAHVGWHERGHA
jgi:pyridinium-3,5-bisthiocarboxylic acid mononucleotide nickel chelatase